jgi:carbamoyl-phosphate synthase large subunit
VIIGISAANSEISIAIARVLKEAFTTVKLVGYSVDGAWPARLFFDDVRKAPLAAEPHFAEFLGAVLNDQSLDYYIPVSEAELRVIAGYKDTVEKFKKKLVINDPAVLQNCLDKLETMSWLRSIGVDTPWTKELPQQKWDGQKFVIKPRASAGSKNMYIIENELDYNYALNRIPAPQRQNFVAQQFVSDHDGEFTCALWKGNQKSSQLILKRTLLGGLTGTAEIVSHTETSRILDHILQHLPSGSFVNAQLRLWEGKPYIFEINPRFSSTVRMRHLLGFCDLEWTILDRSHSLGDFKSPCAPVGTIAKRLFEEVILRKD